MGKVKYVASHGEKFYVGIFREDGSITAHTSANTPELAADMNYGKDLNAVPAGTDQHAASKFMEAMDSLLSITNTYRNFIPITLSIGTAIIPAISENTIERFVKKRGKLIEEHSSTDCKVYELPIDEIREFSMRQDEVLAAIQGSNHIPEVMIIGLISSYDAFLANLLRSIFNSHEEIIFNSEKTIAFNEISKFSSIEEAKEHLVNKEVETLIRKSHHEQFNWMENTFNMKLRSNLDVWPHFVEICERRNLLTHTGGIISQQYLENCKEHKYNVGKSQVGDRLSVDNEYFSNSVDAVSEVGIKLCYVMWRKFAKHEIEVADIKYNHICFDLVSRRSYKLAEELLKFSTNVLSKGGSERIRRMMVVNLANSVRLQGRQEDAVKIIDKEDWSATGLDLQICSNAAKGNIAEVVRLIPIIGPSDRRMDASAYRNWPVFREIRKEKSFSDAFESVFGEELFGGTTMMLSGEPADAVEGKAPESEIQAMSSAQ